jgi:hypothetical protein
MTPRSPRTRRGTSVALASLALVVVSLGLTGCAAPVPLQPAPDAEHAECADVIVNLPDAVAEQPKRETNAQGTGAWGSPDAAVLLHCGVPVPGPTTLPCVSINGVDWINDDSEAPVYRFTTYGRTPATEVVVDSGVVSGSTVLVDLANAVSRVPATEACTSVTDVELPDGPPAEATTPATPAP